MVKHLRRRLATRVQNRAESEQGSLILDILIGMAVFALIAIIAISAIGQYRMRAYEQTAASDATSVGNAVNAFITDNASNPDVDLPSGTVSDEDLADLDVVVTHSGDEPSVVTIIPGSEWGATDDDFEVCVEHRGAYALYATDLGGLYESGNIEETGFEGCDSGGGSSEPCTTAIAFRGIEFNPDRHEFVPYPDDVVATSPDDFERFLPAHIPGLTQAEWDTWIADLTAAYAAEGTTLNEGFLNQWTIYGADDWTLNGDGEYLDGDGAPVTYLDCNTYDD